MDGAVVPVLERGSALLLYVVKEATKRSQRRGTWRGRRWGWFGRSAVLAVRERGVRRGEERGVLNWRDIPAYWIGWHLRRVESGRDPDGLESLKWLLQMRWNGTIPVSVVVRGRDFEDCVVAGRDCRQWLILGVDRDSAWTEWMGPYRLDWTPYYAGRMRCEVVVNGVVPVHVGVYPPEHADGTFGIPLSDWVWSNDFPGGCR